MASLARVGSAAHVDGSAEETVRTRGLLPPELVKSRAASGVFSVASWGVFNLVVGFFASIVLARMLSPRDFGLVAFGTTLIMFATAFSDGGLASGLMRREIAPTRPELSIALGLQLAFAGTLAVAAAAVAILAGPSGLVVASMMLAMPISAFQTPGRVVLTRSLRVRAVTTVESVSFLLYYGWAVVGVLAGLGVWALASAIVFKSVITTIGVIAISGLGLPRPRLRGARALRPVIAFGLRFQSVSLTSLVRDQGLNFGIALISGASMLGLWTLARRLLQVPYLIFEPLNHVSLPYMTQVIARREDPSRRLERGIAVSATASGLVLAATAAAIPGLVPIVFGEQWRPAGEVIPWVCAALLIAGPPSAAGIGYLYAADAPGIVLRATILHSLVTFVVTLPLLPFLGMTAIGLGLLVGAAIDVVVISRGIATRTAARPLRVMAPPLVISVLAGAAGLSVASAGSGVAAPLLGAAAAAVVYIALTGVFQLDALRETARLLREAVRHGLSPEKRLAATGQAE